MGEKGLTIKDTNVLKGIAILLLLFHHVFYPGQPYSDLYIGTHPVIETIAVFSKICVVMFVFLSGYGLTTSCNNRPGIGSVWRFYYKRYVKLMVNYWYIGAIFVALGIICFGRTPASVYPDSPMVHSIADFFGLHYAVFHNPYGYNATWWFYSCIILLYLLFPWLYKVRRCWYVLLPLTVALEPICLQLPLFHAVARYLFAFACGIVMAEYKITPPHLTKFKYLVWTLCFTLICFYRIKSTQPHLWDSVIMVAMVPFYKSLPCVPFLSRPLDFLGQHSFNIFLFHTFIYSYYFSCFIYCTENPLLIYLLLLLTSVLVSLLIERLKVLLRINVLQDKLIQNVNNYYGKDSIQ